MPGICPGVKDGPKPLHLRTWTCAACGGRHDRDVNAARNIRLEGRKVGAGQAETLNGCGRTADRARPGRTRWNSNPPEHGASRAGGIPVVHGGEDVNVAMRLARPYRGMMRPLMALLLSDR
jgi:putative transposase